MKRIDWRWLAVSSVLLAALAARAETRPQYGGVVHVAMRGVPSSLDPADPAQLDSFARRSLTMLMFDTLVTIDEAGHIQPALAVSWQTTGDRRWQFRLRRGVKFHDGSTLTAESAAASLRGANPSWNVFSEGDSVIIERDSTDSQLLAELALPRNAIAKKSTDGKPAGTGPFHIVDWQPGKKLVLDAEENHWRGRPFLDTIEIEMGKSYRDQMTALDLGKAELVEVAPEQAHRVALDARRLANSPPVELLALVFTRDAATAEERTLREALALSVERASIRNVLLQGAGQPAAGVLPNWMSGYAFVFSTDADLTRARHAREQVRAIPTWSLGYDGSNPLDRLLAERIALNAKDAGLSLQPTSSVTADLRLVRIPLASADPWVALDCVATLAGVSLKTKSGSAEDLYAAEQSVLASERIVPLFQLPASYAAPAALKNWTVRPDGTWTLADAWLGSRQ